MGIGNPSLKEKLDATGNMNITGAIKTNGVDGNPNQVLMKNNAGNFCWGNLGDFKNIATFIGTTTANIGYAIPANTTKIWVELWAGGSGRIGFCKWCKKRCKWVDINSLLKKVK